MNTKQLKEFLVKTEACQSAVTWCDGKSLEEAWNACERSDWMIWYLTKKGVEEKTMRLLAVALVREVQHLMNDTRSINALDVAEKFANGEATKDELDSARAAAVEAARSAAWAARRDAVEAARAAAGAASRDAWAAAAAAESAAEAASWAARAAWRATEQKKQADIIRKFISYEDLLA